MWTSTTLYTDLGLYVRSVIPEWVEINIYFPRQLGGLYLVKDVRMGSLYMTVGMTRKGGGVSIRLVGILIMSYSPVTLFM